eukprot:scaffold23205_cov99-Isochrysis_galbana.AAC.2
MTETRCATSAARASISSASEEVAPSSSSSCSSFIGRASNSSSTADDASSDAMPQPSSKPHASYRQSCSASPSRGVSAALPPAPRPTLPPATPAPPAARAPDGCERSTSRICAAASSSAIVGALSVCLTKRSSNTHARRRSAACRDRIPRPSKKVRSASGSAAGCCKKKR